MPENGKIGAVVHEGFCCDIIRVLREKPEDGQDRVKRCLYLRWRTDGSAFLHSQSQPMDRGTAFHYPITMKMTMDEVRTLRDACNAALESNDA